MNNWNLISLAALQAAGVHITIRTGGKFGVSAAGQHATVVCWTVDLHIERPNDDGEDRADLAGRAEAGTLDDALSAALAKLRDETAESLARAHREADERAEQLGAIDGALNAIAGAM